MQQTELNFAAALEFRKDTLRSTASVAYRGGGVSRLLKFKTHICQECGNEFHPPDSKPRKYCSLACVGKRNSRENTKHRGSWEDDAIALCEFEERGFKSIARVLKVPPQQVRSVLLKHGLLNPELNRAQGVLLKRNTERFKPTKGRCPTQLMISVMEDELRDLKPTDESNHWGKHPEFIRWRANAVARSQFAKWKTDPIKKLKRAMRTRLWKVLRLQLQNKKGRKTFSFIGCSPANLIAQIESQFEPSMTWQNFGTVWEIDHKRPCASFDLSKQSEVEKCFHFSNLRPLPKSENRKKSSWHGNKYHTHKLHYEKAA